MSHLEIQVSVPIGPPLRFGGAGFQRFEHAHPLSDRLWHEVVDKRWRELNPSFARLNHDPDWTEQQTANYRRVMDSCQAMTPEVYLTTWSPPLCRSDADFTAFGEAVGEFVERSVREWGHGNLRYYCCANELMTSQGHGYMVDHMDLFEKYQRAAARAFDARTLDVLLVSTDVHEVLDSEKNRSTLDYAADHMADVTEAFCGHQYAMGFEPEEAGFYAWAMEKFKLALAVSVAQNKPFLLAEYGGRIANYVISGVNRDTCDHWDTGREDLTALQVAEFTVAAINSGVYALGYWTYMDFPEDDKNYYNKWGVMRRSCAGVSDSGARFALSNYLPRSLYYAYALFTRYFRGPATILTTEAPDPLRVSAVRHDEGGTISVAVLHRGEEPVEADLLLPVGEARLRKFVFDAVQPPHSPFGDLPDADDTLEVREGRLSDTFRPYTLTVYTSAFREARPLPATNITVTPSSNPSTGQRIAWQPSASPDIAYYRVYRGREGFAPSHWNQIGSTTALEFLDHGAWGDRAGWYAVRPVNRDGNVAAE